MIYLYRYIFATDLSRYQAEGWELCGPMKGEQYCGAHADTLLISIRFIPDRLTQDDESGIMGISKCAG